MRASLSRARVLAVAVAAVVAAAVAVASASATTGSATANGFTVTATLSPDTVSSGQTVIQTASVKNVSASAESVRVLIVSPIRSAAPVTFSISLQPSATFVRSVSYPAALLTPGSHTLTVAALNTQSGATTQATASITAD